MNWSLNSFSLLPPYSSALIAAMIWAWFFLQRGQHPKQLVNTLHCSSASCSVDSSPCYQCTCLEDIFLHAQDPLLFWMHKFSGAVSLQREHFQRRHVLGRAYNVVQPCFNLGKLSTTPSRVDLKDLSQGPSWRRLGWVNQFCFTELIRQAWSYPDAARRRESCPAINPHASPGWAGSAQRMVDF